MAEPISKHCWATPKCGIITAILHFDFEKAVNFKFVIVRNPYRRIVSFYISKVVDHGKRENVGSKIPHMPEGHLDCTFEEMVPFIDINGDRHHQLQKKGLGLHNIHFVRCEHWVEDIALVCDKLGINKNKYENVWENKSTVTDTITEYVGDKPAGWLRANGSPSDYNLFYNDDTKKLVYDLYKPDFDWLAKVYDDLEVF